MGSSKQTSTTTSAIPAWMSTAGQDLYNKGVETFGNATYTQYDPSKGIDTYLNPYTQNVVQNTSDELQRTNTINNQATAAKAVAADAFGGSRHGLVEAENNRNTQKLIADQADKQYADAFDKANALNYTEFMRGEGFDAGQIQGLAQLLNTIPHSTTSTNTQSGGNTAGSIFGGGLALLGAFSDERLKEDRRPADGESILDKLRKMSVDSYKYKDEAQEALGVPEQRTGPMAQEYEEAFKGEGSGEMGEGGPKTIDLADMLGKLMAAVKALDYRTMDLKEAENA